MGARKALAFRSKIAGKPRVVFSRREGLVIAEETWPDSAKDR